MTAPAIAGRRSQQSCQVCRFLFIGFSSCLAEEHKRCRLNPIYAVAEVRRIEVRFEYFRFREMPLQVSSDDHLNDLASESSFAASQDDCARQLLTNRAGSLCEPQF